MLIQRLRGKSDILYLGRSGTINNRTIRRRLLELLRNHHVAAPRVKRLREELAFQLEFSFAETKEPESTEKLLLMSYEKEHYELPPLNHVGGL